ncbi:MAG: sigma-54-dependent Fis family transcriptional regulator, partial [Candidatus Neomarinimicrobiota bacterium]
TANKGTIFLDELGETPLETQVKLLRILESGEFMRVGDSRTLRTDVRLLTATNKDLEDQVRKGEFRQDLYYRLKTVTIHVPPLRHRIEDLPLLVERFALEFTTSNDIRYRGFTPDAIRLMKQYDWPGNIRELKNYVESLLVLERGERITPDMVERTLFRDQPRAVENPSLPVLVRQPSDQAERELILRQLYTILQNTEWIKQMLVQNPDTRLAGVFPPALTGEEGGPLPTKKIEQNPKLIRDEAIGDMTLRELEQEAIERTLKYYGNNRRAAARSLGMSERTLYRKIDEYGLERKIKRTEPDTHA